VATVPCLAAATATAAAVIASLRPFLRRGTTGAATAVAAIATTTAAAVALVAAAEEEACFDLLPVLTEVTLHERLVIVSLARVCLVLAVMCVLMEVVFIQGMGQPPRLEQFLPACSCKS
jgi:hypothetical protein